MPKIKTNIVLPIVIAALILFSKPTNSQDFGAEVFVGATTGFIANRSFNKFLDSYVTLLNPTDTKRSQSSLKFGYNYGAVFTLDNISLEIGYLRMNGLKQKFTLDIGERVFIQDYYSIKTVTSLIFNKSESSSIRAGIIIGMGSSIVESYLKYPNGFKSYGNEKDLNGYFDGYAGEFGFDLSYLISLSSRLSLYFRSALSTSVLTFDYEYDNYIRSISATFPLENLPEDYETYMQTGNAYDYDGEYAKMKALKLELQMGLNYKITN